MGILKIWVAHRPLKLNWSQDSFLACISLNWLFVIILEYLMLELKVFGEQALA